MDCTLASSDGIPGWALPRFEASARAIEANDFVEVTVHTAAGNLILPAASAGELRRRDEPVGRVTGFCDSVDGRVWGIRFLATQAGLYRNVLRHEGP